jgi:hypothetical protein
MEHSPKFETVKGHYDARRWSRAMVLKAIGAWITKEEADEILGEALDEQD